MDLRSIIRISSNFILFPFLYPRHKAYPTFAEHFSVQDSLPENADCAVALGCSLRADGTASHPTRAIADRAAALFKERRVKTIILSGANPVNGVSEGEAMKRVLERPHGISGTGVILDDLPLSKYVGTLDQVRSIGGIFKKSGLKKVVLVVQPQQLPRALWIFRELFPAIEFFPANPAEEYDSLSTQKRMHARWRFRFWNVIAWAGLWRDPFC